MNSSTPAPHPPAPSEANKQPIEIISRIINVLERLRYPTFLLVASLTAFVIVIYFFSPRFVIWEGVGLGTPISYSNPEVNRALFTLKKIETPFQFILYPPPDQNFSANWRFFFPLLGHYLHIPALIFFCLPHFGCLIVLALIIHLVCKYTGNRLLALETAILMATTSWFFVSTGWLTYFDSWLVLGLLVISFSSSFWMVAFACAITPWIDERFVMTLPIACIVRGVYFNLFSQRLWKSYWRDILIICVATFPWIVFHLFIEFQGITPYPVSDHVKHLSKNILLGKVITSHWAGLRLVWIFVLLFMWYAFRPWKQRWIPAVLGIILTSEVLLLATLAGDWSRNMSTLIPAAVLGVLLLHKYSTVWAHNCVFLATVFNLLAPASHGFDTWQLPISNLNTEIEHYKNPPDYLNPLAYTQLAVQLINKGDLTNALNTLNQALYLDSKHPDALFTRASLRQQMGDAAGSLDDFTTLMIVAPQYTKRQHEQSRPVTFTADSLQAN